MHIYPKLELKKKTINKHVYAYTFNNEALTSDFWGLERWIGS